MSVLLSGKPGAVQGTVSPLPHGRGDEIHHAVPAPDPGASDPEGPRPRNMYVRSLNLDTIAVKGRDFR
ncbi:hypothetical protein GCM10011402_37560 [Paracoccus acridae]|uniref:Uncharacterized protein n=1 Tax=Paracoccus acridae TaxID=1795310 RepID=A0ABQ1VMI2_9RHOB|nr:hypothetical protein GCM10011402_37560 [Paracoccus acridae]